MNFLVKSIVATLVASAALVPAHATTVLYRNDGVLGTDYLAQALASTSFTVTSTADDLSSFVLSGYDIVVYANQNNSAPSGDIGSLSSYIASGGRVLFTNWTWFDPDSLPTLNSSYSGFENDESLSLTSLFSTGVGTSLTATNTGWGIFTTGLTNAGGIVAGSFGNGDAAIIVGNGGRTIHNGFLSDTVASSQLYVNELNYLLTGGGVPEPASWAMMIAGFGLVGGAVRRRQKVQVTFA